MDRVNQRKWDRAAVNYDLFSARGPEKRWAPWKKEFFAPMTGSVLFVATGTGLDFRFFPPGGCVAAVDISAAMLEKARRRAAGYEGEIQLFQMDAQQLGFRDHSFDQIFTACTFCSVPDPIGGLRELRRVLRPGGELRMFEHTGSRWFPFNLMLNAMTPLCRRVGPEMNRNTPLNVLQAGFRIRSVRNLYLDVVKIIVAV